MVSISTYKSFWDYIDGIVPGIDQVFVVHEESDLAFIIRDIESGEVILLAIFPSADVEATSVDDYEEIDSCFMFVVKKSDRGSLTHAEYLTELQSTQGIMTAIKHKMIELAGDTDHCSDPAAFGHMMHRLFINGMHTDPEYNLLGCNGWGLSFKLKTKGI
ncbi:MAG: hypothetical protein WCL00_14505 [Bacteroidota bacterium]